MRKICNDKSRGKLGGKQFMSCDLNVANESTYYWKKVNLCNS